MTFTLFLCRQYGSLEGKRGEEGEERERQHTALPGFQVCFSDQTATHTHTHTHTQSPSCTTFHRNVRNPSPVNVRTSTSEGLRTFRWNVLQLGLLVLKIS